MANSPLSPTYNPAAVMMGQGRPGGVYMPTNNVRKATSPKDAASAMPQSMTIGPEAVRATGSGPFDSAYRQNLATYAGGQFMRPGGNLSFNPTDVNTLPGQATGGGNAPVEGAPNTLVGEAIGGQPFSWTPPPAPTQSGSKTPANYNTGKFWLDQFLQQGSGVMPYMGGGRNGQLL